ncbi:MAG TPA: MlaD family protein [Puia sp.]|nr:MlaD family protein [Puia sp.]
MPRQYSSNIKLGALVISGLVIFIFTLYVIGKNENFFGSSFELRVRFSNVSGLIAGDNIRFAGIQAGTVKKIAVIDDSTIEVTMTVEEKMQPYIRKNAQAAIGTEGLMGNKVVNILPVPGNAPLVTAGDLLGTKPASGTDELLTSLARTGNNIEQISEDLKSTIRRVNNSTALWTTLNDEGLSRQIKITLDNIRQASEHANRMTADLQSVMADMKAGKGAAGLLLRDTTLAGNLARAVEHVRAAGEKTDQLTDELNRTIADIHRQIDDGHGTIHSLLQDPALAEKLNATIDNIRQGSEAFSQDMEALKHNFLLRGYFRKQERQAKSGQNE